MSLRSKLVAMVAQAVVVPFVSQITGKLGEVVGDRIALRIQPEEPAETPDDEDDGEDEEA